MGDYLYLIPLFPLIGVLINGLAGRRFPEKLIGAIGCAAVLASFTVALLALRELLGLPQGEHALASAPLYTWISAGALTARPLAVPIEFIFDPLSALMCLVVTGVGLLIHVYSVGYMAGERGFRRFFTYLNLFVFSMLLLVAGDSLLLMFVGWEGVGLCSYLLIGYYYEKKSAADAGKKAFVVNRIGDFGFLLAIFLIFWKFGTLDFEALRNHPGLTAASGGLLTAITLLLFLGATGKSAQIPLYFWLPDAMEGPTPVSALIHAATMVTAGVYMVARLSFLYVLAPFSLGVVATVGAFTALYAASMGFAQRDLKRILAYSTISQLGYMFLGVGVAAFSAGVFHLMTHAFFKALLFMSAGAVMHALHGELDVHKMGALRKKLPITHAVFLVATLAIMGFPGMSGFFSKDEILWQTFSRGASGGWWYFVLYGIGLLTAGMTAFYMWRALLLTFWSGPPRDQHLHDHAHEAPAVMWLPLALLAVLSVVGGLVGVPEALGGHNSLHHFLSSSLAALPGAEGEGHGFGHSVEYGLMALSVAVALIGALGAIALYRNGLEKAGALVARIKGLHRVVFNKYYVDEFNDAAVVRPLKRVSANFLWRFIDAAVIDGAVNGAGWLAKAAGSQLRKVQTGQSYAYALAIALGAIGLLLALLVGA